MKKFDTIILYKGATSAVEFDFTNFEFATNSKCVLTISSLCGDNIYTAEFTQSKKYVVVFKDEFTSNLDHGNYLYNIMYMVDEERYPQCLDSDVEVRKVVNPYESNN